MSFKTLNLHPNIAKAIEACGYTKPTPVQQKAIPEIMQGKDVVACAQTGTGKTAAFVLPALHYLNSNSHTKQTRILVLTPTRELAAQITKAAGLYGKFSHYNIVSLVGGMSYHHQIRDLQRGADIIVATPGRLLDHIEQRRVNLSNIEMLILDEADRMLDMGFIEDVEYIAKLTPRKRQTLLFSATVDKKLATTIRHLLNNPVRIDLSDEKIAAPAIQQEMYKISSPQQKLRTLRQILDDTNVFKGIIFTSTKIGAERLADQLKQEGLAAAALHGDLRQNVRNRTVEELRRGKIQYLVATDVAARGIDIRDVTHVINYDLPKFSEDYVHRIGRTGRAGKTGVAISFVLPTDTRHVKAIERYIGQRFQLKQFTASGEVIAAKEDAPRSVPFDRKHKAGKSHHGSDKPRRAGGGFKGNKPFRASDSEDRPRRASSDDSKPRRAGSGFKGNKPFRATDGEDRRPRRASSDDSKPRRAGSGFKGNKPFRATDSEDRPRRASSDDSKPRRAGSGFKGNKPFRATDGEDKPRRGGEYKAKSFRSGDGEDRPRRSSGNSDKPFRASESKPKKKRFGTGKPASEGARAGKKRNRPAKRDRDPR